MIVLPEGQQILCIAPLLGCVLVCIGVGIGHDTTLSHDPLVRSCSGSDCLATFLAWLSSLVNRGDVRQVEGRQMVGEQCRELEREIQMKENTSLMHYNNPNTKPPRRGGLGQVLGFILIYYKAFCIGLGQVLGFILYWSRVSLGVYIGTLYWYRVSLYWCIGLVIGV
jgi:hypothetical protein